MFFKRRMNKYKIEKGIPIPEKNGSTGLASAFRAMNKGDSVLLPRVKISQIGQYKKMLGIKLVIRCISETEIRVWRMS